ncbi:class II fumarate hydratase [Thioalkalivibrio sp. HK1]|uniref:class II fumarate hydratase n=1 Tax=Thioalkalivibrio sp. HK1 TaxID=1469245 RepID=UPI00047106F6|nr:class II fumarate hydratase [Thioalkalivibrio sp. HK1]
MNTRIERDSMGEIEVPSDRLWGAQTQRSLENFKIGSERLPKPLIRSLATIKKCAAIVNRELGDLPPDIADAIVEAAQEVIDGKLDDHFPLVVWQTGSGTQSNMNVNEVIAHRACERLGASRNEEGIDSAGKVHPNDHVNRSQSTNDVFPTAIHIAAAVEIQTRLLPALERLRKTLEAKARDFASIVKIGRTHLQDATPLTLGQEFSGYADQIRLGQAAIDGAMPLISELPIGGTAVGTGINSRKGYAPKMVEALTRQSGIEFVEARNRFASMGGKEGLVAMSGALRTVAGALNKIANDVRWLASGPRCGIGEILIPANEPGSSIMPGKVNPTQSEALTMVAARVIGNDVTVAVAGQSGNFELNVYLPVIGQTILQSIDLLAGATDSFDEHCASGIEPDLARIEGNLRRSLMLVTALNPHIGYDRAADVAKTAWLEGKTLREVVLEKGLMSGEEFDRRVVPEEMVGPRE